MLTTSWFLPRLVKNWCSWLKHWRKNFFFWLCTCMPWCGSPFRAQELSLIGLQLNGTKTKVLMTSTLQEASHVEICGTMVAILHGEMTHKYLGRKFPSNLNSRTEVELIYRIQCAWSKFHQHKLILLNKHVTLRLRLKLFHATVSSTAMFGLASLPLTQRFLHKLDVVQRRMLRSIVGWVRIPDEPSENTMRRMNQRMEHVAYLHPLPSWSNQYFTSQYRLANQFSWAATAVAWMPLAEWVHNFPSAPSRSRGRPPKRWDQAVASFSCTYFGERNWWVAAQNCKQWLAAEAAFVKYCESMWRTKGSPCPFRIEVTRTGEGKNITPTNLFGLMTCPLISNQLPKLEVVRNRMSRSIVGWAPLVDNDWHALRQRMNRYLVTDNKMLSAKRSSERVGVPSAKSSPSLPALLLPTLIPPPTTCQTAMCLWAEEFWCGCASSPRALFGSGHHTLHQRGSTSIRRCLSQISTGHLRTLIGHARGMKFPMIGPEKRNQSHCANGLIACCAVALVRPLMWSTICNRQPRLSRSTVGCYNARIVLSNIDCGISKQLFLQQLASPQSTDHYTENIWGSMTFNFENLFVALWGLHRLKLVSTLASYFAWPAFA